MKKENKRIFFAAVCFFAAFVLWTVLVCFIDVAPIGPLCSSVGFSSLNSLVHDCTGVNMTLYIVTDWLGLVPIAVAFGFAVMGLIQWIKRKSILRVDIIVPCMMSSPYQWQFGMYSWSSRSSDERSLGVPSVWLVIQ